MTLIKKLSIAAFFLMFFICTPQAQGNYVLCPLNCEQDRKLCLTAPNMEGKDVIELQKQLKHLGFYHGIIDGSFGPATEKAVRLAQKSHGLKPSGIVDQEMLSILYNNREHPVAQKEIPPPTGKISIVIDTVNRTLTIFSDHEPYRQFNVAVGKPETPTPIGNWTILRKAMNWGTGFGTRWMGLNVPWGIYGIHGTNKPYSIGGYESHGCIRMHNYNVEAIYPVIPVGTPVYIIGNPMGVPGHTHRVIPRDEQGSDVAEVQRLLKKHGYYNGPIDGIFGSGMAGAVIKFRKDHGLPHDDRIDAKTYAALGL